MRHKLVEVRQKSKVRGRWGKTNSQQQITNSQHQMQLKLDSQTKEKQKLEIAEDYFQEIASQAALIDKDSNALKEALKGMGDRNLLALRVPKRWGGAEFSELDYRCFQMAIARYSGALAFLQTQHQSAAYLLAKSGNESLKQEYLPEMGTGKILVGVGFSQLRRLGEPLMKAKPVTGGYELEGEVPWLTGWGFFSDVIIGAILPDGGEIYAMVPLQETQQELGGKISFSAPMELAVMGSTNTVSAKLSGWFERSDLLVSLKPSGSIHESSKKNVLHHGFFALGCARAGLDILEVAYQKKQLSFIQEAFNALDRQVINCRQEMLQATSLESKFFEEKLKLRARAINLAGRCSQAAVIVSSGAANNNEHPAQRVYREALLFSVSGQTTAVMEASLSNLLFTKE